MKKFLRSILSFLERKFPDRLEVTLQEYEALKARVALVDPDKIKRMEQEISKFNVHLGFGGGLVGKVGGIFER